MNSTNVSRASGKSSSRIGTAVGSKCPQKKSKNYDSDTSSGSDFRRASENNSKSGISANSRTILESRATNCCDRR